MTLINWRLSDHVWTRVCMDSRCFSSSALSWSSWVTAHSTVTIRKSLNKTKPKLTMSCRWNPSWKIIWTISSWKTSQFIPSAPKNFQERVTWPLKRRRRSQYHGIFKFKFKLGGTASGRSKVLCHQCQSIAATGAPLSTPSPLTLQPVSESTVSSLG